MKNVILKFLWWRSSPDEIAENEYIEGWEGILESEKERRKMSSSQLAIRLSHCDKDSPAYILFDHELNRRIAKIQALPAYLSLVMTIVGLFLGWALAQWKPFEPETSRHNSGILSGYVFADEIDDFNHKYKFITEAPGVQRLYLDTKSMAKKNQIATIKTINLFIRDGKLYQEYRSKFPKQNPSYSVSEMELNCQSMQMRVNKTTLYSSDDKIIEHYTADKKWNQVQMKNTIDKLMVDTACK